MKRIAFSVLMLASASPLWAGDSAKLEGTQIIGSREVPKVLYIVPWKKPLPAELIGRPVQSLLDEALAPIDRYAFRRQVRYHDLIQQTAVASGEK